MRASIVIPVWNGVDVIGGCLDAVRAHATERQLDVICIDNGSRDGSAELIERAYPWARLIRQPTNLGFAGGVNAGVEALLSSEGPLGPIAPGSSGEELFILLNQDCLVHAGWMEALCAAFKSPALGVAGCTIFRADGSLDHAGAEVRRPDAVGAHRTQLAAGNWAAADYVTGAAMAIRRSTWEIVGRFDEGFYPAYYEDADYCYRARRHGFQIGHVPGAQVTHLFSSQAWQADALAHTAGHHRARYRFVAKHFAPTEIDDFVTAEAGALTQETYLDQAMARAIAARDTLRSLPEAMQRRVAELDEPPPAFPRQMAVALHQIRDLALAAAARLLDVGLEKPPLAAWQARNRELREDLAQARPSLSGEPAYVPDRAPDRRPASGDTSKPSLLAAWREEEDALLARLHFHPRQLAADSRWRRGIRYTLLRALSVLTGREDVLQTRLLALHRQQLAEMARQVETLTRQLDMLRSLLDEQEQQAAWQWGYEVERLKRRIELLETLAQHD